jgi:hypothetical protein
MMEIFDRLWNWLSSIDFAEIWSDLGRSSSDLFSSFGGVLAYVAIFFAIIAIIFAGFVFVAMARRSGGGGTTAPIPATTTTTTGGTATGRTGPHWFFAPFIWVGRILIWVVVLGAGLWAIGWAFSYSGMGGSIRDSPREIRTGSVVKLQYVIDPGKTGEGSKGESPCYIIALDRVRFDFDCGERSPLTQYRWNREDSEKGTYRRENTPPDVESMDFYLVEVTPTHWSGRGGETYTLNMLWVHN